MPVPTLDTLAKKSEIDSLPRIWSDEPSTPNRFVDGNRQLGYAARTWVRSDTSAVYAYKGYDVQTRLHSWYADADTRLTYNAATGEIASNGYLIATVETGLDPWRNQFAPINVREGLTFTYTDDASFFIMGKFAFLTDIPSVPVKSVNAKTGEVILTGADIAVSGSDETKISAALADKAAKADATLTPVYGEWVCNPAKVLYGDPSQPTEIAVAAYKPDGEDAWALSDLEHAAAHSSTYMASLPYDQSATSLTFTISDSSFITKTVTATRAVIGYALGSQTDKPLASEAEAEALRTATDGKLDKSGGGVAKIEWVNSGQSNATLLITFANGKTLAFDYDGYGTDTVATQEWINAQKFAQRLTDYFTAGNLVQLTLEGGIADSGIASTNIATKTWTLDELTNSTNIVHTTGNELISGHKRFDDALTIGTQRASGTRGTGSFVQGNGCLASGEYSSAQGLGTIAQNAEEHA